MKFTDDEVIKALECCTDESGLCVGCPFWEDWEDEDRCRPYSLLGLSVDIIHRQKAEIEKLGRDRYQILPDGRLELLPRTDINAIKAEAIKEFANCLLKKVFPYDGLDIDKRKYAINAGAVEKAIKDLVKELTEAENES